MKVIIPKDLPQADTPQRPNHKARREIQKRISKVKHAPATKADVEKFLALAKMRDQIAQQKVTPFDNIDIFPNGTEVKLNYEAFLQRNHSDYTEEFRAWMEEHKEEEFHIDREEEHPHFVVLQEDVRYTAPEDGTEAELKPKWLFDLFSDLLVKDENGEYTLPGKIPGALGEYAIIDKEGNAESEAEKDSTDEAEETKEAPSAEPPQE